MYLCSQTKQRDFVFGSTSDSHGGFSQLDHAVGMRLCFRIMERGHRGNRLQDALLAILREQLVLVLLEGSHIHLITWETDSIAPGVFGRIHRGVCHVKQLSGAESIKRIGRQAKAGRERDRDHRLRPRLLPQTGFLRDGATQAFGQVERLRLVDVREQDGELFASIASDVVALADALAQAMSHCVQRGIACRMPPGVIDVLEMIDINKDDRTITLAALALLEFRLNALDDGTMIGQAGEWIGQCSLFRAQQFRLGCLVELTSIAVYHPAENREQEEAEHERQCGEDDDDLLRTLRGSQALNCQEVILLRCGCYLLVQRPEERCNLLVIGGERTSKVVCINEGKELVGEHQVAGLLLQHHAHKSTVSRIPIPHDHLKAGTHLLGGCTKFGQALSARNKGILIEARILRAHRIVRLLVEVAQMDSFTGLQGGVPNNQGCSNRASGEEKQDRNQAKRDQALPQMDIFHEQAHFRCNSCGSRTWEKRWTPAKNYRQMWSAPYPSKVPICERHW